MIQTRLCDREDACLLIVDIQEKLSAAMPPVARASMYKNTEILLHAAKKLDIPAVATVQYPKGLGPLAPSITEKLPNNSQQFSKTCFSCLGADGFKTHLIQLERKQIILAGMEAHICILQSAIDLLTSGWQVYVVIDAIASRHKSNYLTAKNRLEQSGATLITTESILFEWLRDATHPAFKELAGLIA